MLSLLEKHKYLRWWCQHSESTLLRELKAEKDRGISFSIHGKSVHVEKQSVENAKKVQKMKPIEDRNKTEERVIFIPHCNKTLLGNNIVE